VEWLVEGQREVRRGIMWKLGPLTSGGAEGGYDLGAGTFYNFFYICGDFVFIYSTIIGNVKNFVFWDISTQFVPHRRHITSPLQSPAS
jgi:hypothetical protein